MAHRLKRNGLRTEPGGTLQSAKEWEMLRKDKLEALTEKGMEDKLY